MDGKLWFWILYTLERSILSSFSNFYCTSHVFLPKTCSNLEWSSSSCMMHPLSMWFIPQHGGPLVGRIFQSLVSCLCLWFLSVNCFCELFLGICIVSTSTNNQQLMAPIYTSCCVCQYMDAIKRSSVCDVYELDWQKQRRIKWEYTDIQYVICYYPALFLLSVTVLYLAEKRRQLR